MVSEFHAVRTFDVLTVGRVLLQTSEAQTKRNNLKMWKRLLTKTISPIKAWVEMVQFDLAKQKTDVVLITNHRRRNAISICVGDHIISLKPIIKYLGVLTDAKTMSEKAATYLY